MDRSRLEAFSDGVFAVAITLLALDLTVAGPGHGRLIDQLYDKWPAFLAYLISFFMIGIVWVNHMQPTYVEAPWGGYKQSGFGRELGPWGIEEYLETKQVHINLNEQPIGWY